MKNELKHLDEFRRLLESYKLSDEVVDELSKVTLVVLTAPTSAGRNTIIRELVKGDDYRFLVSDTTRHPRMNDGVMEEDGTVYWFKTEEEVLKSLKNDEYIAPAIIHAQQVSAINVSEIIKTYKADKIAVTEIEVQGVKSLSEYKPDLIAIFVVPPSFEEWMDRIKKRGLMSGAEFKRRLTSAINEFTYALESDNFIFLINDDLSESVEKIRSIVSSSSADMREQELGRKLVTDLKEKSKKLFSTLD